MHGAGQVAPRQFFQGLTLRIPAPRFEGIGQVHDAVERRHALGAERVLADRRQHLGVVHAEEFSRQGRRERRMQNDRVIARKVVDRNRAAFALADEPRRRIEPREIVQHARQACLGWIGAVPACEVFSHARDAHAVLVPVLLSEVVANLSRELNKRQPFRALRSARMRFL